MPDLIEFVRNYSLSELRRQRDKYRQMMDDKRRVIDAATVEFTESQNIYRMIDSAVRLREAQESKNGNQLDFSPSASPSPSPSASVSPSPSNEDEIDKTTMVRQILTGAKLTPAEVFHTLIAQGIEVRRPYVYTVIQRLKKRGQIDVEDGKYFAA
jgi:hypothetical protein